MPQTPHKQVDTKKVIAIKGAKMYNLKNVDVQIKKNSFTVITGVSGSGKSSLAIDTLYAEGQRRYVESLSAYVRQFMGKLKKPDVYAIHGITPAIAIRQKVSSKNPRSTVGTVTEIIDYLKLLFTRIGDTFSPISGEIVKKDTPETVLAHLSSSFNEGDKFSVLSPLPIHRFNNIKECLEFHQKEGFTRIEVNKEIITIDTYLDQISNKEPNPKATIHLLIDRCVYHTEKETISRLFDSVSQAFSASGGQCILLKNKDQSYAYFTTKFEKDGIEFTEPSIHFFSFNNPLGACDTCQGFGNVIDVDPARVILNPELSLVDDVIECWKGEKLKAYKHKMVEWGKANNFPVFRSYNELTDKEKDILWNGNAQIEGIHAFFDMVKANTYKIQYRVLLSRFRGKTICPTCKGGRLKEQTNYVKVGEKSINELSTLSIKNLHTFFKDLSLDAYKEKVAKKIIFEITSRLGFIADVGLDYLTLDRLSSSLSGGESQRINLASSIGSSLVGSTYILDEPSIGLHSKDSARLINVLQALKNQGNTLLVVEHDEDIMRAADDIIDMGPLAGIHGGEVVAQGTAKEICQIKKSLTGQYLNEIQSIETPSSRRKAKSKIVFKGCREHNLKNIDLTLHSGIINAISGVSGSGKSTLVREIIYPALKRALNDPSGKVGAFGKIEGDIQIQQVEFIDQNPIGKSSRSNPATYVKAYDDIRTLFSLLPDSKYKGFKSSFFSFNTDGGRCDACKGEGVNTIEMQFMADVTLPCENCNGKRFKEEVLDVHFHGKNIAHILETPIDQAIAFFKSTQGKSPDTKIKNALKKIIHKLEPLDKVGLGYVALGQSSSTLSGGEAQRVKLASFLTGTDKKKDKHTLFIFDEPTTGLHFHDIKKLLVAFNELIEKGHTLLLIEHHLDVLKCADYITDLGPYGGDKGGEIVCEGTPEEIVKSKESFTAQYLRDKIQ